VDEVDTLRFLGDDEAMTTPREFDIALFGATGFTGGLIADYLAAHAPEGATIAIAGRTAAKVAEVRNRLDQDVTEVIADVSDPESLRSLAGRTRVLISTVGPYTLYGEPVVKACVEAGTDYVDLTGEPEFVDRMFLKFHERAMETSARIIHACGFDSIPHDLGAQFTVEQLPEGVPITVRGYVTMNGTFSGGTAASALEAMSHMGDAKKAHTKRLAKEGQPLGRIAEVVRGKVAKSADTGRWALPMPTVDPEIVVTSARSLERYGPEFRYSHLMDTKSLPQAVGTMAGLGAIAGLAQIGPARRWMGRRVPPGTGPAPEKRATSWFKVRFFGEGGGVSVVTEVAGGDPGYGETAKMISESALCLAFDDLPVTAGQVTTAAAMGSVLRGRLESAGITFTVLPTGTRGEPVT